MKTIPALFNEAVELHGHNPMMYEYGEDGYVPLTYLEMNELVHTFANGLLALGLQKGDRVLLVSEGRNDWVMSELAVVSVGAINVPVSVKIEEPEDLLFRISHSESSVIIVSGRHAFKIIGLLEKIPLVKKIIILDPFVTTDERIICRDEFMKLGMDFGVENPEKLAKAMAEVHEDDVANICYTSGTTADPKGILLSHLNYYTNVEQAGELFEIPTYYTSLLILPWDHSFAHTAGIYALLKNGASMASVQLGKTAMETLKNVPKNIRENKPHFLLSVPALAKNFRKNIEKGVEAKGRFLKSVFDHGIKMSIDIHGNGFNPARTKLKCWKRFKYNLISKVIYKKVRGNFGGRLEFFVGGGALLDLDLQYFFYALGIPMFQGYGLTEAAPIISSNTPARHKLGSSGYVVDNLELKICDPDGNPLPVGEQGEIVVKGKNVMKGYWKNEAATAETIRDGWLYTGDMGFLDEDGFLYVLGRFKSLLIGNDGEKYSPESIEEAITEKCTFVDQVMLINNQHPYTSMLLVPNKASCSKMISCAGIEFEDEAIMNVLDLIKADIDRFRDNGELAGMFPQRWLPSAIAVLDEEFSESNQMLNSTMKIVRGKISEHYSARIEHLYTPEGKEITNKQNIEALKKYLGI